MEMINESDLGVEEAVDDLVAAHKASCKHQGVKEDDFEYFRRYVFMLIAMQALAYRRLKGV